MTGAAVGGVGGDERQVAVGLRLLADEDDTDGLAFQARRSTGR